MHSRPRAEELIVAVEEHLREKVVPALVDPQVRYHTLVAVHVLGIVARELANGEEAVRQEWATLSDLFNEQRPAPERHAQTTADVLEMNTRLADEILTGGWDDDTDLITLLKYQVGAKLDVSNPKFRR